MAKRSFYDVLGVSRTATQDEIRKAYKKLARKFHPDVKPADPDAEKKFAEITEAYEVLGDEEKRRNYDQFGQAFRGGSAPGGNPFHGMGGEVEGFDLNDLLGGMFGGGSPFAGGRRAAPRPQKGQDVRAEITIPFIAAVQGGEHSLTVQTGSGKSERLSVKIPAGIEEGQSIRLSGQGSPGAAGGPSGDLLITVHIAPHPWFRREGRNLTVEVPVTPSEAALGARIDVPTLTEGLVVLSVPPGTSSGAKLRLRGKGVAAGKSGERGDQFVILRIVVPKTLSDEAKDLYQRLASATPQDPRKDLWK